MASPQRLFGLPAKKRVRHRRDFAKNKTQGRRMARGCLVLNWRVLPSGHLSRVGVVTGRKIGPATVRNRARRLMREAFRLHQNELTAPVDMILVARSSIVTKRRQDVERDFLAALRQVRLLGQSKSYS